jgi:hypothetical protein
LADPVAASPLAIWNPNAAVLWSLVLTPTFGTTIQMLNWRALGEPQRAATATGWVVASFVLLVLSVAPIDSEEVDRLLRLVNFVFTVGWCLSTGRVQVRYVKARLGTSYPRRRWGKPLLIGLAGFLAVMALAVGISLLMVPT